MRLSEYPRLTIVGAMWYNLQMIIIKDLFCLRVYEREMILSFMRCSTSFILSSDLVHFSWKLSDCLEIPVHSHPRLHATADLGNFPFQGKKPPPQCLRWTRGLLSIGNWCFCYLISVFYTARLQCGYFHSNLHFLKQLSIPDVESACLSIRKSEIKHAYT